MNTPLIELAYLFASVSFVIGLKMLSHPDSARKGNWLAALGMGLAIILTMFVSTVKSENYIYIISALAIGTILGTVSAKKVNMKAMPQMVSLFNGMGGACAAVISLVEFNHHPDIQSGLMNTTGIVILLGMLIGSVSFSGSMIAFGKLQGYKAIEKPVGFPLQKYVNFLVLVSTFVLGYFILAKNSPQEAMNLFYYMFGASILYGILFVLPIGGADMPVVISLLNSFTGMAAAFAGFLYNSKVMLTGGILVGSAGTILTVVMCTAMNRSLFNVIFGSFGASSSGGGSGSATDTTVREVSITDAAILMSNARKVVIVPGYGLAVAQAQHTCHQLDKLLEEKGVEVSYAIHPVAGRMPGHMNVLLAEADVPYPKLLEMDEINPQFSQTDVVLVIGANDVVNPAARNNPQSPIYGMPILDVDNAKNIIVMKRSMNAGYAGIDNELFYDAKTKMLFGDAKGTLAKLVSEVEAY
ncbi:MAG: NAD(P)(+) transhydrogenase (Re/Si-specific) subunit beta [Leptospiraceae bacterium]|nr:NAD(P)(+) transhydrogenase (Re/Si-specific) subunit beta [Leptospiraceae bacterium]MCK6381265.1 NAD(P)(+) transhydrogenase (Re/Si-specific) subunit beta [Leptospiraceae bacterium]